MSSQSGPASLGPQFMLGQGVPYQDNSNAFMLHQNGQGGMVPNMQGYPSQNLNSPMNHPQMYQNGVMQDPYMQYPYSQGQYPGMQQYSGYPGPHQMPYNDPPTTESSPAQPHAPFRLHNSQSHSFRESPNRSQSPMTRSQASSERSSSPASHVQTPSRGSQTPPRVSRSQSPSRVQRVTPPRDTPSRGSIAIHAPVPTAPIDIMEPQNVSFIEKPSNDEPDEVLPTRLSNINITSGSRTYKIHPEPGSPKRPVIGRTFRVPKSRADEFRPKSPEKSDHSLSLSPDRNEYKVPDVEYEGDLEVENVDMTDVKTEVLKDGVSSDQGFVISFDDSPKRPKPQFRSKKPAKSPKTPSSSMSSSRSDSSYPDNYNQMVSTPF